MREPSTCLEALCLNSREAEGFTVGVVGFEAIGGGSPLDSDSLRFSGDVSRVLRDCLLEDVACREQRHFDLVGDGVVLILTAVLDAVHEFAGHAGAAEFVCDLQVQSHGEVLIGFHGHAVGHNAVEHQAVGTDFTEIELDRLAILQSLDFIDAQRIQLRRNHLHVLRVIRALRLDSEEVRLGGELLELGLHFVPTSFRER